MFPTPILLITFNRPVHTRQVLQRIVEQQPQRLYVFQDGARDGNEADEQKCDEVRKVVEQLTAGTTTQLFTNYSDKNLGCGAGPATAISWFFANEEMGIVMEDDCLAHPDFFGYCDELLKKYADCEQVQFINATLYHNRWQCAESYGFSHYMVTGAWAAWRRSWQGFDLDLKTIDAKHFRRRVRKLTDNGVEADWWYFKMLDIKDDCSKKSYWDFQMQVHLFLNDAVTIHPRVNLISNIGFDPEGTHTLGNDGRGNLPINSILPLTHPEKIAIDLKIDANCFAKALPSDFLHDTLSHIYRTMLYSHGVCHWLLMKYKQLKNGK